MPDIDRRTFVQGCAAALGALLIPNELIAAVTAAERTVSSTPVKVGVIGLGQWGRTIVNTVSKMPGFRVTAIADTYKPFIEKCGPLAPKAAACTDYRTLLDSADVEAVVIATPSHRHRDIALAAIQADKHVYCEAPLASTIEDAREIARAGMAAKRVFQAGLQGRSSILNRHVLTFLRSGALGKTVQAYAQVNTKQSWRRAAPTADRAAELNWRLDRKTSPGLLGEMAVHSIDLVCWQLGRLAVSVSGWESIQAWKDGRDVADTVECSLEFPNDVRMAVRATLASSLGGSYTVFQGTDSSILVRDDRAWMFREADAPALGWEVYARKEPYLGETGICLVADATKLIEQEKDPGKEGSATLGHEPLYYAMLDFATSIRSGTRIACPAIDGYRSTVTALKAGEAVAPGTRAVLSQSDLEL